MSQKVEQSKELPFPTVAELLKQGKLLRGATSWGNCDVYTVEIGSKTYLVKTFANHNWFVRKVLGDYAIANEAKILQKLRQEGITVGPECYAVLEKNTIVEEFLAGYETLKSRKVYKENDFPSQEVFSRIGDEIRRAHQLGFAHGDVRRNNILYDNDGNIRIIDWATGSYIHDAGWFGRWLHRHQVESDNYSTAKLIGNYYPDMLTEEQVKALQPSWLLRLGRWMRQHLYRHGIKRCIRFFKRS